MYRFNEPQIRRPSGERFGGIAQGVGGSKSAAIKKEVCKGDQSVVLYVLYYERFVLSLGFTSWTASLRVRHRALDWEATM